MKNNCIDPKVFKSIFDNTTKNTSKDSSLLEKIIELLKNSVVY